MRRAPYAFLLLAGVAFPCLAAPPPGPPELKKLHVLVVLDTNSNLADGLNIDRGHLEQLFSEDRVPRNRITVKVMTGKEVTRENILAYYRDRKVGPDEGLFFFYGGHGGRTPDSKLFFALESLKGAPFFRAEVLPRMERLGLRSPT